MTLLKLHEIKFASLKLEKLYYITRTHTVVAIDKKKSWECKQKSTSQIFTVGYVYPTASSA